MMATVQNYSSAEVKLYLEDLQSETTVVMIPVLTFLCLLLVTGAVGNTLSLWVYWRRFPQTPLKMFIKVMACYGLLTVTVSIPGEIYESLHKWDFDHPVVCKIQQFLSAVATIGSGLVVVAVAMTRYRKICRPFSAQVNMVQARAISAAIVITSLVVSVPYGVINGTQTKPTPRPGVHGYICDVEDAYVDTIWPVVNAVFFLSIFLFGSFPTLVMYVLVSRIARRHRSSLGKKMMRLLNKSDVTMTSASCDEAESHEPLCSTRITDDVSVGELAGVSSCGVQSSLKEKERAFAVELVDERPGCGREPRKEESISCREIQQIGSVLLSESSPCAAHNRSGCLNKPLARARNDLKFVNTSNKGRITGTLAEGALNESVLAQSAVKKSALAQSAMAESQLKEGAQNENVRNVSALNKTALAQSALVQSALNESTLNECALSRGSLTPSAPSKVTHIKNTGHVESFEPKTIAAPKPCGDEATKDQLGDGNISTFETLDHIEPLGHVELLGHVEPLGHVEVLGHVELLGHVEPLGHAEPIDHVATLDRVEPLGHVEPLSSVETLGHVEPVDHVEPIGHVESLGHVEPVGHAEPLDQTKAVRKGISRANTFRNKERRLGRTSCLLLAISLVFICSFLPSLALECFKNAAPDTFPSMGKPYLALFHLFHRTFLINSVANSTIYSVCDVKFRKECAKLVKCI